MSTYHSVRDKYMQGAKAPARDPSNSKRAAVITASILLLSITLPGVVLWWNSIEEEEPTVQVVQTATPLAPLPDPARVDYCIVLAYEEDYFMWRYAAQRVLYGKSVEEPNHWPMWYMLQVSPRCNVDYTVVHGSSFTGVPTTMVLTDLVGNEEFVRWKQRLQMHTGTPDYIRQGGS